MRRGACGVSRTQRAGGFTLIEVMVALAIVALGMSALLEMLTLSAGNVAALRDKTVAEWIAMNKIADTRLLQNGPTIGTTQGDIDDCARGTWHWRQDVSAVSAIPGLVSITVSVRRTGNSVPKTSNTRQGTAAQPFGGPASLGATRPLGSVSTIGGGSCIATVAPGDSLGAPPSLGAPNSLGAPSTLGSSSSPNGSPQLGAQSQYANSLGVSGTLGAAGTGANANGAAGGAAGVFGSALGQSGSQSSGSSSNSSSSSANSSSSSSSSSDSANAPSWLVTLTGFRGNSIAPANGEMPNWIGASFAGAGSNNSTNGPGANNGGVLNNNGLNNGIGGSPGSGGSGPFQGSQPPLGTTQQ